DPAEERLQFVLDGLGTRTASKYPGRRSRLIAGLNSVARKTFVSPSPQLRECVLIGMPYQRRSLEVPFVQLRGKVVFNQGIGIVRIVEIQRPNLIFPRGKR